MLAMHIIFPKDKNKKLKKFDSPEQFTTELDGIKIKKNDSNSKPNRTESGINKNREAENV